MKYEKSNREYANGTNTPEYISTKSKEEARVRTGLERFLDRYPNYKSKFQRDVTGN